MQISPSIFTVQIDLLPSPIAQRCLSVEQAITGLRPDYAKGLSYVIDVFELILQLNRSLSASATNQGRDGRGSRC